MRVLVTGAEGFIGQHLIRRLRALPQVEWVTFTHSCDPSELSVLLRQMDWVFHLAGVNRPQDPAQFMTGNWGLTQQLCQALAALHASEGQVTRVVYASSTQAVQDNPYGRSKKAAEEALQSLATSMAVPHHVFRLPNVFGPGARANYNSAVATFCHNLARDLPIQIHDPAAALTLVYVKDVVHAFVAELTGGQVTRDEAGFAKVPQEHRTTVGQVADWIRAFRAGRVPEARSAQEQVLVDALAATYRGSLPEAPAP